MTGIDTPSFDPEFPDSIARLICIVEAMRERCAELNYWDLVPRYEARLAFLIEAERRARKAQGEAA